MSATLPLPSALPGLTLTADAFLRLTWLASPALPVGGFSYSEGLESAVESGRITDEASAGAWLCDVAALNLARADLPVVAAAWRAWNGPPSEAAAALAALNDWVLQTRESGEFRQQALQMGRSLSDWLRQRAPDDARLQVLAALQPAATWPLAFALAAAQTGAPAGAALLCFAFGWAENMVQAAVKSVPLGQSAGQRLLARLVAALPALTAQAEALPDDQRQSFSPMLAILSAQHEAQYSRLFRS
jgi:urease accessory protein